MNATRPSPPRHLSKASKAWWRQVLEDYELAPQHLRILQVACEAWDRKEQAREQLEREGPTYLDRFDAPRKHPSIAVEEAARLAFLRACRELDLDGEPAPEARPPRRR